MKVATAYQFVSPTVTAGLMRGSLPDGHPWERVVWTPMEERQIATSLELSAAAYAIDAEMHRDVGVIFTPELHDVPHDASACRCGTIAAKAASYTRSVERTVLVRVWIAALPEDPRVFTDAAASRA